MLITVLLTLSSFVCSQEFISLDVTGDYEIAMSYDEEEGKGRRLRETGFNSIRIVIGNLTSGLSAEHDSYIRDSLIPSALKLFEAVVSVQRRTTPIVVTETTCVTATVPENHKSDGVRDVDVLIYLTVSDPSAQDPVTGGFCEVDAAHNNAPIVGAIEINVEKFSQVTNETMLHAFIREIASILGTSEDLQQYYYNPDTGATLTSGEISSDSTIRGKTGTFIETQYVTQKAIEQFGCNEIFGVEIEKEGSVLNRGRWDERIMHADFNQLEIGDNYNQINYSAITFALLQDSGWYQINYAATMDIRFGYQRGWDFFLQPCLAGGVSQFPEFCDDDSADQCDYMHFGYGACTIKTHTAVPSQFQYFSDSALKGGEDGLADYCPIVTIATDCRLECAGCRCVQKDGLPACHVVSCVADAVVVTIAGEAINCTDGATIDVNGVSLECPLKDAICRSLSCLNNCGDNGTCTDGICICESGWSGTDCNIQCDATCNTCRLQGADNCESCKTGAALTGNVPSSCACIDGQYGTADNCQPCHGDCLTCSTYGEDQCDSCHDNASLPDGQTTGTCTCDDGFAAEDVTACQPCDEDCLTCVGTLNVQCLTCKSTATLVPQEGETFGQCKCPEGEYDPTDCKECPPNSTEQDCFVDAVICNQGAKLLINEDGTSCICEAPRIGTPDNCIVDCSHDDLLTYDYATDACSCIYPRGITPYGTCELCAAYILRSEILAAEYLEDFSGFKLTFQRNMLQSSSCGNLFESDTFGKIGSGAQCYWDTPKTLTVIFGTGATLVEEVVVLNSLNVLAEGLDCGFLRDVLEPQLEFKHDLPQPTCDFSYRITDVLEVHARGASGGIGRPLYFTWTVPGNIPYKEADMVQKEFSYQAGNFTITLALENWLYQTSRCSQDVLQLGDLYVEVAGNFTLYQSQEYIYTASVTNRQEDSVYSYQFEFVSTTLQEAGQELGYYDQIIGASQIPNQLYIAPNLLLGSHTYEFKVTATDDALRTSGTRHFTINVANTPIVAAVDRTDSYISAEQDLVITTQSIDPDNTDTAWGYQWSCDGCLANDGTPLISGQNSHAVTVHAHKLVVGATYRFELKVTKDTREDTTSVTLIVAGYDAPNIFFRHVPERVNPQEILRIQTYLTDTSLTDVNYQWKLASGSGLEYRTSLFHSYLVIEKNSMVEGQTYTMTLDAAFNDGLPIASNITFTANTAPRFGSVSIIPSTGDEMKTDFEILASTFEDTDLPLTYSFYYSDIELAERQESNILITQLPNGDHTISGLVCDSLHTCVFANTTATVNPASEVTIINIGREISKHINLQDPDSIPAFVSVFSNEIFKNENNTYVKTSTTSTLISSVESWVQSQPIFDDSVLDAALGSLEQISNIDVDTANVEEMYDAIENIIESSEYVGVEQTRRFVDLMCRIECGEGQQKIGQSLCDKSLTINLPDETPNTHSCPTFAAYSERKSLTNMLPYDVNDTTFQIQMPSEGFQSLANEDSAVLDMCMIQYGCANTTNTTRLLQDSCLSAPTLDIHLNYVGTYSGNSVQLDTTKAVEMAQLYNFTLDIDVTCDDFQVECESLDGWNVTTLQYEAGKLLCQTNGQGRFTAKQKEIVIVVDPSDAVDDDDDDECSMFGVQLVPVYILIGVSAATLCLVLILCEGGHRKTRSVKIAVDPESEEPGPPDSSLNMTPVSYVNTHADEISMHTMPPLTLSSPQNKGENRGDMSDTKLDMVSPKSAVDTEECDPEFVAPTTWQTFRKLHFFLRVFRPGYKQQDAIALGAWLLYQLVIIGFIYFAWEGPGHIEDAHTAYVFLISVAAGLPLIFFFQLLESALVMTLPLGLMCGGGVGVLAGYMCHSMWSIMFALVSVFELFVLESVFAGVKTHLSKA